MISEVIESLRTTLSSRAKSSFMGSFVIAWCWFNWKALYASLILSTDELPYREAAIRFPDKLSYLATLHLDPATGGYDQHRLLWWPLCAAALTPLAMLVADEAVGFCRRWIAQGALWVNKEVFKLKLVEPRDHQALEDLSIDLKKRNEELNTSWLRMSGERDLAVKAQEEASIKLQAVLRQLDETEVQATTYSNKSERMLADLLKQHVTLQAMVDVISAAQVSAGNIAQLVPLDSLKTVIRSAEITLREFAKETAKNRHETKAFPVE